MQVYIHTYIYIYIYIHTHTHMYKHVCMYESRHTPHGHSSRHGYAWFRVQKTPTPQPQTLDLNSQP